MNDSVNPREFPVITISALAADGKWGRVFDIYPGSVLMEQGAVLSVPALVHPIELRVDYFLQGVVGPADEAEPLASVEILGLHKRWNQLFEVAEWDACCGQSTVLNSAFSELPAINLRLRYLRAK